MAKKKFVVACYEDDDLLFPAIKKSKAEGYKIHDVYTPFAVHGLDHALGMRETSIHTVGFIFGITGTATALGCMGWIFTRDWPQIYGGKPHFPLPAFIPITFELTVLFAAIGMVMTFMWLCKLAPGVKKHHFDLRATDDLFVMPIECTASTNVAELEGFLKSTGAAKVNVQEAETEWWFGRYDEDDEKTLITDLPIDAA